MSATELITAARKLSRAVSGLPFSAPVTHVYNPLDYAWACHEQYLRRYGEGRKRIVFVGMNPGPFGMTQTGVPFGEIAAVRDWLRLDAPIGKPAHENPARPIEGWACPRSEVSGRRLWGLFAQRFGEADNFFAEHFVANYCPLAFFAGGRNLTPDKLSSAEAAPLFVACNAHLVEVVRASGAEWVIGIGGFAEDRAREALAEVQSIRFGRILHPSPASPAANRGWAEQATRQMQALGLWDHAG
ncbi:MAG: single-stranded DNA-binding protein [Betaproteobacteria bacterium]|nr:single-stranded DNA-binding protein [Betaproteobacteria bacterium]